MKGRAVIFGAGNLYGRVPEIEKEDFVVAADAGYILCFEIGIKPDLVIGDFDSSDKPETEVETLVFPTRKDDTDMMLAVKEAFGRGYRDFDIYGGTGGLRSDHTFANIQVLSYLAMRGARGIMYGEKQNCTVIHNSEIIIEAGNIGRGLSVFSLSERSEGVCLTGTEYTLENGTLFYDFPLGVSNSVVKDKAVISVKNGTLLIIMDIVEQ